MRRLSGVQPRSEHAIELPDRDGVGHHVAAVGSTQRIAEHLRTRGRIYDLPHARRKQTYRHRGHGYNSHDNLRSELPHTHVSRQPAAVVDRAPPRHRMERVALAWSE
jgi:hypothetical protein